jgi:hypothetical protein
MILAGTALLVTTTVYLRQRLLHTLGIEGTQSCPAPEPAAKPIPFTVRAPVAHVLYSIPMPLNDLMILSLPLGKGVAATATPPSL